MIAIAAQFTGKRRGSSRMDDSSSIMEGGDLRHSSAKGPVSLPLPRQLLTYLVSHRLSSSSLPTSLASCSAALPQTPFADYLINHSLVRFTLFSSGCFILPIPPASLVLLLLLVRFSQWAFPEMVLPQPPHRKQNKRRTENFNFSEKKSAFATAKTLLQTSTDGNGRLPCRNRSRSQFIDSFGCSHLICLSTRPFASCSLALALLSHSPPATNRVVGLQPFHHLHPSSIRNLLTFPRDALIQKFSTLLR